MANPTSLLTVLGRNTKTLRAATKHVNVSKQAVTPRPQFETARTRPHLRAFGSSPFPDTISNTSLSGHDLSLLNRNAERALQTSKLWTRPVLARACEIQADVSTRDSLSS